MHQKSKDTVAPTRAYCMIENSKAIKGVEDELSWHARTRLKPTAPARLVVVRFRGFRHHRAPPSHKSNDCMPDVAFALTLPFSLSLVLLRIFLP